MSSEGMDKPAERLESDKSIESFTPDSRNFYFNLYNENPVKRRGGHYKGDVEKTSN